MAKSRQQHSIESAILGLTKAMRIDALANPTEEQKMKRQTAMLGAADIIENSGIITLAEHGDDNIETRHQVDAVFEQAGIDPVQFGRDNALAGAANTVEQVALEQAVEQIALEAAEAEEVADAEQQELEIDNELEAVLDDDDND